jgi:hypothetical protein
VAHSALQYTASTLPLWAGRTVSLIVTECREMSRRCRGVSRRCRGDVARCHRMSRKCREMSHKCRGDVARCRGMSQRCCEVSTLDHLRSTRRHDDNSPRHWGVPHVCDDSKRDWGAPRAMRSARQCKTHACAAGLEHGLASVLGCRGTAKLSNADKQAWGMRASVRDPQGNQGFWR